MRKELLVTFIKFIQIINPLSANGQLYHHEDLTFLWTGYLYHWTLRWVLRSFATHASLCNTLSSNKLCPKTVKILALRGLKNIFNDVFCTLCTCQNVKKTSKRRLCISLNSKK